MQAFAASPHVIFSIVNEPFQPDSTVFLGTPTQWSANVWNVMNTFVSVIRQAEVDAGSFGQHLIAVQVRSCSLLAC